MNYLSKILKLDSNTSDIYHNQYSTSFTTHFDAITANNTQSIIYSLQTISIPYSWYSCNQYNQYLDIYENVNGATYTRTVIIPAGNYSAQQYMSQLLSLLNTVYISYSMQYNTIQNRYLIGINTSNTTSQFLYLNGPNEYRSNYKFLGFDKINITLSSLSNTLSSNCVVMSDIYYLQLCTDLGNVMISNDGSDQILEVINIPTQPFSFIHHSPINTNKFLLQSKSLSNIRISLLDNYNRQINLNGIPYHITFRVEIIENDSNNISNSIGRSEKNQQDMNYEYNNLMYINRYPSLIDLPVPVSQNTIQSTQDYIDYKNIKQLIKEHKKFK